MVEDNWDTVCDEEIGVDDTGTVELTDTEVDGTTDEEQGMVDDVVIFWQWCPSSYVPSGQPQPSTTGPRQHLLFWSQVSFFW